MSQRGLLRMPLAVLFGILVGGGTLWFLQLAWRKAGEYDANPRRATIKNPLMRQQAEAMDDVLDEVVYGRLDRVSDAAARMLKCATAIDGFLATDIYINYGDNFHQAIADVKTAAEASDKEAVKDAILRLESSCIECHFLINQPSDTNGP